ncbi:hypothetical protein [Trinickia mobilis]|uniref:hypothetical protein n=1 Tax=Trinickia mobilis TaxID=2816356 RepID=UPI001A8FD8A9|nr:hypothetical protein [Trinickia mobilis]
MSNDNSQKSTNRNTQRAREVENQTVATIASVDAMTVRQVALLNYGVAERSAIVGTQRLLKRLRQRGWVARTRAGDGVYRYFLTESGCAWAETIYDARFSPGYDRSYLNSAVLDIVIEQALEEAWRIAGGIVMGRGLLRSGALRLAHPDIDAIVASRRGDDLLPVRFIVRVGNAAPTTIRRLCALKQRYGDKLRAVGEPRLVSAVQRRAEALGNAPANRVKVAVA